ncbi:hypothetical protein QL093DRAFT_2098666 [Fusarium oxysporum]|nr:hypothetical protein QL093DRAFT_2098666 [Fusarium oxysporum]
MSSNGFANGLSMPTGGLAARRGGQNPKPLSVELINQTKDQDPGAPTPSHQSTAPKSATAASFGPQSPTTAGPTQQYARNSMAGNAYGMGQDNAYNAPKTAYPQYGAQNNYNSMVGQQYTVEQVLAPPELAMDEQNHDDPGLYAQLLATNMYLAQQQQRLQQQLRNVQAAAQQFQQLNLNNSQFTQQQIALYEQQQQLQNLQLNVQAAFTPAGSTATSPAASSAAAAAAADILQPYDWSVFLLETLSLLFRSPRLTTSSPRPPALEASTTSRTRPRCRFLLLLSLSLSRSAATRLPSATSPPTEVAPLPPPSANAFRRGHKKASSLAPVNSALAASLSSDAPKSAGPKTSTFPITPLTGGYGPGQARAGEHPIRQPRGPPSLDELKAKPTAKHEGSKNFTARTRRSAVHNLVRAGLERRKGTGSSCGSMSPVSETAEESSTPITDNESDSGRSGSGSLAGDMECPSSRTSASGSWGAIGSDRPSSRQKARKSVDSVDSVASNTESENSSFANVFKNGALRAAKAQDSADGQRKAPRLVLTKSTPTA